MWWSPGAFAGFTAILTAITNPPSWDGIVYRPWYAFVMFFAALPLPSVPKILYFSLSLFFTTFLIMFMVNSFVPLQFCLKTP